MRIPSSEYGMPLADAAGRPVDHFETGELLEFRELVPVWFDRSRLSPESPRLCPMLTR